MRAQDAGDDRSLFEGAACGLLSTSDTGALLRVNRTLCQWLGFAAEELIGKKRFQDLLTMGSKLFHQTHWMPLLQVQGSVAEVQLELLHRDGHAMPMLVNAVRHVDGGTVRHDLALFVTIDRRKYERELLAARKRAEELLESERAAQEALANILRERAQEARQRALLAEQLVGIVSHDLRTPLNVISLAASLLSNSDVSPAHARTVARIGSSAQRANRLIADLLDFTQARLGGGLRVDLQPINLHQVVSECVEELRLVSPGRAIEHRALGDGQVQADDGRIAQVVTNLTGNALSYGDPARPITIGSETDEKGARLSVQNFGRAIPPELLPHIFEPMRRGEHALQLGSRSVGLGLYIVHEIAKAHAGEVTVRSSSEDGTTFTLELPHPR